MSGRWRNDLAEYRGADDASARQALIVLWGVTALIVVMLFNFFVGILRNIGVLWTGAQRVSAADDGSGHAGQRTHNAPPVAGRLFLQPHAAGSNVQNENELLVPTALAMLHAATRWDWRASAIDLDA